MKNKKLTRIYTQEIHELLDDLFTVIVNQYINKKNKKKAIQAAKNKFYKVIKANKDYQSKLYDNLEYFINDAEEI